jgi:hypothetical protein
VTWTKLDDAFWSDPEVDFLGNEAAGVFVRMLSYCGQHLTNGHVPANVVRYITTKRKLLDALEGQGFVRPNGDGYFIPQYLKHNPSRETVLEQRRKDAERKAKSRGASA